MNEKFLELPREKQQRIINAAMEIFSQNEYKRAITDDIAALAGISKGLLFYYFHNKKGLYYYVYEYAQELITSKIINDDAYKTIDDFFELIFHSIIIKINIMKMNPYIYDFMLKTYFETEECLLELIDKSTQESLANVIALYFQNIDKSKFLEDVEMTQVLRMIIYMAEGYMREQLKLGLRDLEVIKKEYSEWIRIIKRSVYKEEYLV